MVTPSVRFDFLFCPFLLGTPENAGVVDLNEVQVELFASKEQHMMQLYCSRYLNNAYGGTLARRARAGHLFGPVPHR